MGKLFNSQSLVQSMKNLGDALVQSLHDNPSSFMETILPEDRPSLSGHLEKQRQGSFSEMEYRIRRPDGTVRWIRDHSFPIRHTSGKVYRTAGMAEDITERKYAELALLQN